MFCLHASIIYCDKYGQNVTTSHFLWQLCQRIFSQRFWHIRPARFWRTSMLPALICGQWLFYTTKPAATTFFAPEVVDGRPDTYNLCQLTLMFNGFLVSKFHQYLSIIKYLRISVKKNTCIYFFLRPDDNYTDRRTV